MEGDIGGLSVANYDLVDPPPSPSPSRPGLNPPPTQASSAADAVPAVKPPTHVRSRTLTRAVSFPNTSVDADVLRRLRRWMICWAVVEFDLDTGPDLDNVYPPTRFSPAVQSNIAFSSLPEGDFPSVGAHSYSWRIPVPPKSSGEEAEELKPPDPLPLGGDGYLHGYVWFVQERKEELRRGYSQRSLVLITHLPCLPGLFASTLAIVAPLYFKHRGGGMVEAASHNIASWPDLSPALESGATLDLPFLGTLQTVSVPLGSQPQWHMPMNKRLPKKIGSPSVGGPLPTIPASIPLTPLSVTFHSALSFSKILLLWELVLLGEPILISSPDPRAGAEMVHHLTNLIRPIAFAGDYRPYFHIHDTDFQHMANPAKAPPGAIVSTTNPLVVSTCKHWPNVLRLHVSKTDSSGSAVIGLQSERKRHVKKDPRVAKAVEKAFASGDYLACDAIVFQHLASLTELFLSPMNRYFGTLPSSDTSFATPLASRSFTPSSFLTSLRSHGTPLVLRATAVSSLAPATANGTTPTTRFYARFLQSPNFASWLHERMDAAGREVRRRYLERLEGADWEAWLKDGRDEGEVEELVARIEREATISDVTATATASAASAASPSPTRSTSLSRSRDLERDANRGARLRSQASRLRTLKDEERFQARSGTSPRSPSSASGASLSGNESDASTPVGSYRGTGLGSSDGS